MSKVGVIHMLIVLGKSQYGAMNRFALDLRAGFEKNGCVVDWWDNTCTEEVEIVKCKNKEYDFVLLFNLCTMKNSELYTKSSSTLFWSFMVDSPVYHLQRLQYCNKNVIVSFIDRNHLKYAERELNNISYITFMPHGGSRAKKVLTYDDRKRSVVFFGSYTEIEDLEILLDRENEPIHGSLENILNRLYSEEVDFVEVLEEELNFKDQNLTEYLRKWTVDHFGYIYSLIRNVKRVHLLEILGAEGITVEVYGNGWEKYVNKYPDYIHICGPVEYEETLEIMGDARIVLNNMPLFVDGSHERVPSAMRCGAVVLSEENVFLRQEFVENEEIVFFNYKNLGVVPEKIKILLEHEDAAEYIAESGRKKAEKSHSWEKRAELMLEILCEIKEQQKDWGKLQVTVFSECDEAFNRLLFLVHGAEEELLYEKMKENMIGDAIFCVSKQQMLEKCFHNYPYWGKLSAGQDMFEVCKERAHQLKTRAEEFLWLYIRMADETSKEVLLVFLQHWLYNTSLNEMPKNSWKQYFDLDIIRFRKEEVFVDCGAYRGDTFLDFAMQCKNYKKVFCYEFDKRNLDVLRETAEKFPGVEVRPCAVGSENGEMYVREAEDSSSSRLEDDRNGRKVPVVNLDTDIKEEITFLKADIEGAEKSMLEGARGHIQREKPKLAIAVYHGNADILDIPQLIDEMNPEYDFYLRYYGGNLYPNEIVLYAI